MAYARRSQRSARRPARTRRSSARTTYRSRAVRAAPRRSTSRRRSSGGSARTIRIEVVQGAQPVARPEIGMKVAPTARKAAF